MRSLVITLYSAWHRKVSIVRQSVHRGLARNQESEESVGIERSLESCGIHPDAANPNLLASDDLDDLELVALGYRRVEQLDLEHEHDLVAGASLVREDVLEHTQKSVDAHLRAGLLQELPCYGVGCPLAELDSTTERPMEALFLDRVKRFEYKDLSRAPDDRERDRTDRLAHRRVA